MKNIYIKSLLILFIIFSVMNCSREKLNEDEPVQVNSDSLETLYERGMTFHEYLDEMSEGNSFWKENHYRVQQIRDDLLSNARTIPQSWKLLAVTELENTDAENTIPYIARLTDRVHSMELRIIGKENLENLINEYQTYDGRSTTPLILVLNSEFEEVGCWVERPAELQRWIRDNRDNLEQEELNSEMVKWYRRNQGTRAIDEITRIVKAANAGDRICPVPEEGLRSR